MLKFDIESGKIVDDADVTPRHTILSGIGEPDNSLGNPGDFYIETESWEIYQKGETWGDGVSLIGASGKDGLTGRDGETIVGKDGVSISDVSLIGDALTISLSDGELLKFKIPLPIDGINGTGILSIEQAGATITLKLSDGRLESFTLPKGSDAREIELQATDTHVQWRRIGDSEWVDLYAIPKSRMTLGGGGRPKLVDVTAMLVAGTNVTITPDLMANTLTFSASGGSAGHTIQDEGIPLTARTNLNFVGAGVTTTDDSGNNATIVTIPGNPTSIVDITGTKAQFDTACTDGNFLYAGDVTQYTDEMAQDAIGAMVSSAFTYIDSTPLLALTSRNIGAVAYDGTTNIVPQTIQTVDDSADTTCFPAFFNSSGTQTGGQQPKTNSGYVYSATTNQLGVGTLAVSGVNVPITGIYRPAANTLGFSAGTALEAQLTATAFSPGASDGNALGTTALMWGDLFLASGGVINFNNGNYTLTHSAGALTASGTLAASNLSGANTGDQTITLTGDTTGSGTGSFTTTVGKINGVAYNADPLTQYIYNSPALSSRNIIQPTDTITTGLILKLSGNSPSAANPNTISNLAAWYKADSLVLSNGDPISTWADSGTNSRDVTQTGTARPTYRTNVINSLPVVRFDGVDDYLALAQSFISGDNWTIIAVSKSSSGTGPVASNDAPGQRGWVFFRGISGGNFETGGVGGTNYTASSGFDIITVKGGIEIYTNGIFNSSSTRSIPSNSAAFEIGHRGFGDLFNGDIAELIIYSKKLSLLERAKVETYLSAKYAITVSESGNLFEFQDSLGNTAGLFSGDGRLSLGEPMPSAQLSVKQNNPSIPVFNLQFHPTPTVVPTSIKDGSGNTILCIDQNFRVGILTSTPSEQVELAGGTLKITSGTFKLGDGTVLKSNGNPFSFNSGVFADGLVTLKQGSSSSTAKAGGAIFDHYVDVGNSTTTETDLYSDTIPASSLGSNGDKLSAEYGGTFVSSATATRQIKIYFGGTAVFDTGALTLSLSSAWTAYVTIIRVSSSVIRYMISFTTEGATLAAYTAVGELTGLTLSNTNILKITGQAAGVGAATGDITAKLGSVNWQPAA